MATEAKKTVTKKVTTDEVVTDVKKVETSEVSNKAKVYNATDPIQCESVTAGKLMMIGKKTGTLYVWNGVTDVTEIEYQDLKAEILVKSKYLFDPLMIVKNDDLLATKEFEKLNTEVYAKMMSVEDMDDFFELDNAAFKRTLESLPSGLKNTIKSEVVTKIEEGSLDSLSKIKIIDEVLGTDLVNCYLK